LADTLDEDHGVTFGGDGVEAVVFIGRGVVRLWARSNGSDFGV